MKSIKEKSREVINDIKDKFVKIDRPWVIGYSGGKDSTCVVQLVWQAISELPEEERKQKVFIVSSDTMVETPVISDYLQKMASSMSKSAKDQKLPISFHCVLPDARDTFWVNLLGKGYPAPRTKFRWCTDRLKIAPANKFILDVASKFGEVIVVLGTRKGESVARDQVLSKNQSDRNRTSGAILPRHSTLANAYVYAPIINWSTDDVWEYLLLNSENPWGTSNRDLSAMYKDAADGECPLVIDKGTASCGNSRFGCWVCTVVERNKSLENIVDKGEEWLEPLLNYRNLLMETTDPAKKAKFRSHKRRTGAVQMQNDTLDGEIKIIRGPYYFQYRKKFLLELLKAQRDIGKNGNKKFKLITEDELREIRRVWITEENDWEDSVPKIYREVFSKDLNWEIDDAASFSDQDLSLLDKICKEHDVPTDLVAKLIDKEREFSAMGRRSSLIKELDSLLKEEWRSEEEMMQIFKSSK